MLSLAGTAVSETQERLTTIAVAYGVSDARIVVLPTALMISFGRSGRATLDAIPELAGTLRLDQISALYLSRHGRTDHIAARASDQRAVSAKITSTSSRIRMADQIGYADRKPSCRITSTNATATANHRAHPRPPMRP